MNLIPSMKIIKIVLLVLVLSFWLLPNLTFAVAEKKGPMQFAPNVSIPGSEFKAGKSTDVNPADTNANSDQSLLLVRYIKAIYKFFVGIAGIVAVFMIVFGGVMWIFAAGSAEKINKAKEIIVGAVSGLVLAVGSYVILNTVNPSLVSLQLDIATVPGFTTLAYFCEDVVLSQEITGDNALFKDKDKNFPIPVQQSETLCAHTYIVPEKNTNAPEHTCHGIKVSGAAAGNICGFKKKDGKLVLDSVTPKDACENINDGLAEDKIDDGGLGITEGQSACDLAVRELPQGAHCYWMNGGVIMGVAGCRYFDPDRVASMCDRMWSEEYSSAVCDDYEEMTIPPIALLSWNDVAGFKKAFCNNNGCNIPNLSCHWKGVIDGDCQ